jgi:glutamate/tyrosine decarboxylase-like PLP-dependent enzyme
MPLWFALTVHGIDAHTRAVRAGVRMAEIAATRLAAVPGVSMVMQPTLGVVLFRREGWGRDEWKHWGERVLREGIAFVAASTWKGEPVGRLVFMHPRTPDSVIDEIIVTLID